MPTLTARPTNALARSYDIAAGGAPAGTLATAWMKTTASLTLGGRAFDLVRTSTFGPYQLDGAMGIIATAIQRSVFRQRYDIEFGRRRWTLQPASMWGRRFVLLDEGGQEIGEVTPDTWWSTRCRVTVPDDVPTEVAVFVLWLVVVSWRRSAAAA